MRPIGMTLCSGIGAPEVAAPWVDWRFASEIETFPREVLMARHGYKPPLDHTPGDPLLWGDMAEVTPDLLRRHGIPLPDILVAGTPCQAFSVAGRRGGLDDARGNLTLKFVEVCHALNTEKPGLTVLWENVPGVLSDKTNAFGCLLGGIVGAMDALQPPDGRRWPGEGMVQGPRARAAWAVLDAQWFGVAQRRRRVFLVADFGGRVDPAAVLLEPDGVRGDSPPSRETGQAPAGTLRARVSGGGGLGTDLDPDGGVVLSEHPYSGTVSAKWAKGCGGPAGDELQNIVAFDCKGTEIQHGVDVAAPLRSMGHLSGNRNAGGHSAVAFDLRGRDGGSFPEGPHDTVNMRASSGGSSRSYLINGMEVRRLTPRECERLQGFPDDYTLIRRGRKRHLRDIEDEVRYLRQTHSDLTEDDVRHLASDGPRYKALGNSMAVPVVEWIMDGIRMSMEKSDG